MCRASIKNPKWSVKCQRRSMRIEIMLLLKLNFANAGMLDNMEMNFDPSFVCIRIFADRTVNMVLNSSRWLIAVRCGSHAH